MSEAVNPLLDEDPDAPKPKISRGSALLGPALGNFSVHASRCQDEHRFSLAEYFRNKPGASFDDSRSQDSRKNSTLDSSNRRARGLSLSTSKRLRRRPRFRGKNPRILTYTNVPRE